MSSWERKRQKRDHFGGGRGGRGGGWDASRGNRDPTPFAAPPDHHYGPHDRAYQQRGAWNNHGRGAGGSYSRYGASSQRNQGSGLHQHGYYGPGSQGAKNPPSYPTYGSHDGNGKGKLGSGGHHGYSHPSNQGDYDSQCHDKKWYGYKAPPSQDNDESSDIPVLTKPWEEMTPKEQYKILVGRSLQDEEIEI